MGKLELFMFLSNILHQFTLLPESDQVPIDLKGVKSLATAPKAFKIRAIKRQ